MTAINKIFIAIFFTLSLYYICYAAPMVVQFPNEGTVAVSPNGKYSVFSIESQSGQTNHVLMIEDTVKKKKWSIYAYDRHVEVLWSPRSDKLIINDHAFSNRSECVLYDVNKRDVLGLWKIVESNKDEKQVLSNHHVYLSCTRWLADDRVEVMLSAYGDFNPEGIEKTGVYQLGSNKIDLEIVKRGK